MNQTSSNVIFFGAQQLSMHFHHISIFDTGEGLVQGKCHSKEDKEEQQGHHTCYRFLLRSQHQHQKKNPLSENLPKNLLDSTNIDIFRMGFPMTFLRFSRSAFPNFHSIWSDTCKNNQHPPQLAKLQRFRNREVISLSISFPSTILSSSKIVRTWYVKSVKLMFHNNAAMQCATNWRKPYRQNN